MSRVLLLSGALSAVLAGCCPSEPTKPTTPPAATPVATLALPQEGHLHNLRQLTFGGDNAEAYWSFAGDKLIMQTNHAPYQCDQIEEWPLTPKGPGKLVSSGKGRDTCSYFLKGDQEIIYASTEADSPACPTPPDMSKGYYWGLFEYDIYRANADGTGAHKITDSPGYDAEATVCPIDGSVIFTSTRDGDLELYRMDIDGKNVKRLTNAPGYDGGAVWSPDCSKIAWRASRPKAGKELDDYKALLAQKLVKPTHMELYVANADGSDARQITYLPGASFGPAFYPDGKRLIFASNYLAPTGPEFDLYGIDLDGEHLERLTFAPSFDGFPMFSPDGKTLSFSSNRRDVVKGPDGGDVYRLTPETKAGEHDTNVFLADWSDEPRGPEQPETAAADRFATDVRWLADDAREGRGIGTNGLIEAAKWVAGQLQAAGVEPGAGSGFMQPFEVTTSLERGTGTALVIDGKVAPLDAFVPVGFSASATVSAPVAAIGWGMLDVDKKIDDFKGVSLKGKIALVHRFVPAVAKLSAEDTARYSDIRYKAFLARGRGAVGLIVVDDGDATQDEAQLPPPLPGNDHDAGIPIVVVTRATAAPLRKGAHTAKITVELKPVRAPTDNVIGVIHAGAAAKQQGVIVIGAHVDHLGMGGPSALDTAPGIHHGADDNASGVAALLETARTLVAHKAELTRDVYVVAFSGEEAGVLGSDWYVKHPPATDPIVAMINMDMVGRMRMNQLTINGGDTAAEWKAIVGPACTAAGVECSISGSGYGPSDHMSFYVAGVPVLFLFTGSHLDYHKVSDTADKINAAGGAQVAAIVADVALATANHQGPLTFVKAPPEVTGGDIRRKGASLGTVPSYNDDPAQPSGLLLSDVVPDGPAAKVGMKGGDRIVEVNGVEIRNVNDFMIVLEGAKPGTAAHVTFLRDGKKQTLQATFGVPRGRR